MILLTVFFECGRILFFFSEFLNSISLQISIKKRVCVIQCNKCSKTYKKKQLYIQFVNCGWKNVLIKPYLLNLFLIITCTIERHLDLNKLCCMLTVFLQCGRSCYFLFKFLLGKECSFVIQCNNCNKICKNKLYKFVNCAWKNVLIKQILKFVTTT